MKKMIFANTLFILVACGGGSSSDQENLGGLRNVDIRGSWKSNCYQLLDTDQSLIAYVTEEYEFESGDAYIFTVSSFEEDSNCFSDDADIVNYTGTYTLDDNAVPAADDAQVYRVDLTRQLLNLSSGEIIELALGVLLEGDELVLGSVESDGLVHLNYEVTYNRVGGPALRPK